MSNLPAGAFLTTINGKQCTAVPRNPRSAAPERTSSQAPAVTTAPAPLPTQTHDDQKEGQQPESEPQTEPETQPQPPPQPEPQPTSAPEPLPAPDSEVVSSVSTSLEDPSASQADPANRVILTTSSTSTSVPSIQSQPPAEDNAGGGNPFKEEAGTVTNTTPLPDQVVTQPDGRITTIGLAKSTARDQDGALATNTPDADGGAVQSDRGRGDDAGPDSALIGGIVGGVVGLAIIAFLVWFCIRRRRKSKRSRFSNRFSTRMTMPPGAEKRRNYEFDSGSVGPTPRRQRFAAAIGYHANKFGRGFMMGNQSTNTVNMNRGNSQFLDALPSHSRENSASSFDNRANLSRKDRFLDWWSRLKEDVNFNWRLRNGKSDTWATRNMMEKDSGDMEPDFLGLLAKDEKRRSMGNSLHARGASVSSIDRFLGDLGMDIDNSRGPNPFSDSNVASAPKTTDPFADTNAIQRTQKPPNTYVADVRRSRGSSVGGAIRASNISTVYRDSVRSDDSFETRRNKCRSDPFDLELDHRRLPSLENIQAMPSVDSAYGLPPRPSSFRQGGHTSYNSSRYTRASSLGDWSDPGPDVGPSASTVATTNSWTSKPADASEGRRKSRNSGGSESSAGVGKAL
ncbi:hypothetical protein NLU13_2466 [Sarocladium strictum]|uniref:Uncharacterized protein n=1 Tax=Sarocladium strictum TaxID=5046 RepID=A0AA39GBY7_SARSR|nr:hypothetical protein NLU13_8409 [Sarocladium strictum]KAK0388889.1 hypothetical protein NLU13_2466 [Sarocladium strictum]